MKFGRLSKPCAALIAVVAIAATAQPAKADLYLTITDQFTGQVVGSQTLTSSSMSGQVVFEGWTFDYSGTVTDTATKKAITLDASVTGDGTLRVWNIKLSTDMSSGTPTSPGMFAGFTGPGAGQLELSSSLTTTSVPAGSSVSTSGAFYGFNGTSNQVVNGSGVSLSTVDTKAGPTTYFQNMSTSFDLTSISIDVQNVGPAGSTVSFVSTTAVALPEPSGVVAAFAGLPCMGLLVRLVRRRSGVVTA